MEIAQKISFEKMRYSMYRARRAQMDIIPRTLEELGGALAHNDRLGKTVDGRPFYMGTISDGEGGSADIFSSPTFIPLLHEVKELNIDGKFKVRPLTPPSRQLLTVKSMHFKKVSPLIFSLNCLS